MASTKVTVDNAKKLQLTANASNVDVIETLDYGVKATVELKFKDAAQLFEMGMLYKSELQEPVKRVAATANVEPKTVK